MENIIELHLKNKEDYKNKYNDKILSYELSNYILEETKGINTNQKIKFHISTDFEMSDQEKNDLIDMIRNNFGADIGEIMNLHKKQNLTYYSILIIAIILIIIYYISENTLLVEFIEIFGWVLLGEAICNFFYKGIESKHEISRRKQIVNAKVIFEPKQV